MLVLGNTSSVSRLPAACAHVPRKCGQNVLGRVVDDRVHRVEPQAVDVELVDPVAGVGDE